MRTTLALTFLALTGCSRATASGPSDAGQAPPASVSAAAPEPARAAEIRERVSYASIKDDVLDECNDLILTITPPPDAGADWKPKTEPKTLLPKPEKGAVPVKSTCREQFADRDVLALCVLEQDIQSPSGAVAKLRSVSGYYDFGTVGTSDAYMRECMSRKGDWKAEPRDSDVWRKAKLDHSRRRFEKLTK